MPRVKLRSLREAAAALEWLELAENYLSKSLSRSSDLRLAKLKSWQQAPQILVVAKLKVRWVATRARRSRRQATCLCCWSTAEHLPAIGLRRLRPPASVPALR